jgi:uncharacterized membrane protein YbhN (UPF0104 family)
LAKINKINGKLGLAIKLFVSLVLLIVLIYQLLQFDKFSPNEIVLRKPILLFVAFILMPINWMLEGVKWGIILSRLGAQVSFYRLIVSLLTGISSSLFTPNRSGNFIGRMIWLPNRIRVEASVLTIYGNVAQWIAAMLFGVVGIVFYVNIEVPDLSSWIWIVFFCLSFLIGYLYLKPSIVPLFISRFVWKKQMEHSAVVLDKNQRMKWQLLLLSMMRHTVFSVQYVLILSAFTIPLTLNLVFGVWTIYFLMTLAPSLAFGKLLVRENVAVFVLAGLIPNSAIILSCSLILWFINLSLPAILGGVIWYKWNPKK